MSRTDVQDYLIERLCSVIESAPISYVKWDFNRSMCDKYSACLEADRQGEMTHRFYLGLYRILETLLARFPHLLIEGCSGGGGRFDTGMLYYTNQIWTSDDTDPIERLDVQYGTSFGYPVSAMGAHVSASPNHQTGRETPFSTRGIVAMSGTFGYELDVNRLSEAEKQEITKQIKVFRQVSDILQYGEYFRLTTPKDDLCTVWEMSEADGSRAVVNAVFHHVRPNIVQTQVKLKGLDPEALYKVEVLYQDAAASLNDGGIEMGHLPEHMTVDGASLMDGGFNIPVGNTPFPAVQILLTRV